MAGVCSALVFCAECPWITDAVCSDGSPYGYDVGAPGALGRDVVKEFRDAMRAVGIAPGYYYSLKDNFYLNVHSQGAVAGSSTFLPGLSPLQFGLD